MTPERAFINPMASGDSETVDRALRAVDAAPTSQPGAGISPIVQRAQAGDRAALEAIARELLRRLLGRRADMEDLVQTVFLEMCRALPGFRGESALSTFVGGITVRIARRATRKTAWERFRVDATEEPISETEHPERRAIAAEQLRRVHRVLESVAVNKRVAFKLWALEGMDVGAIAEVTGASVSATRSRIFYAQKELKACAASDPYLRELVEGADAG